MLANVTNRWQAFAVHLLISAAIFLFLLSIIVFIWYPGVFIHFGGYQGIVIVAGVDLVLGPLLTLVVFKRHKPSLKLDLSVIAGLQIIALGYGVWEIYNQRPIFQVFSHNYFYVVSHDELKGSKYEVDKTLVKRQRKPVFVALHLPGDTGVALSIETATEFIDELPIKLRTDLYKPMPGYTPEYLNSTIENSSSKDSNCILMTVLSTHRVSKGCIDLDKGLLNLIEE